MKTCLLVTISLFVWCYASSAIAGDPTIAEIKTAWSETVAKTKSCRFNWTETRQIGVNDPISFTYSLSLKDTAHLRMERLSKQFDTDRNRNITETYVTTFDGRVARSFYGRDFVDARLYPTGFVSFKHSDWDNYHILPILFAVRPINRQFSPVNNREYAIADKTVQVAGRELLELRPSKQQSDGPPVKYLYFVDPERRFAIARVIAKWKNQKLWQIDISNRLDETSGCWVPDSWKLRHESRHLNSVVRHVQFDLDSDFTDDHFVFEFPGQTLITDRTFIWPLVYMLRNDGLKRIISSEERKDGIHYMDYLDAIRKETDSDRD